MEGLLAVVDISLRRCRTGIKGDANPDIFSIHPIPLYLRLPERSY